jgi:hypothetical protein
MTVPSRSLLVLLALLMLAPTVSLTLGGTRPVLAPGGFESGETPTVLTVLGCLPDLSPSYFPKEPRHAPVAAAFWAAVSLTIVVVWRRLTCDGLNGPFTERSLLLTPTFASYL